MDRLAPAGSRHDVAEWLAGQRPDPRAALRLFCLPYAGGAAAIYRRWPELVPDRVQVCALELPGRGYRLAQAPFLRMAPLVRALAGAVEPLLDRPFAIFGHSMGGLIAFELVRVLRARGGPLPAHLFVSAAAAPGPPSNLPPLAGAPDAEVLSQLRSLNGTPQELLDNDELMALVLPVVRADFSVLETYEYRDEPPLPVPLTVFGGASDRVVPPASLAGWRRQSCGDPRIQLFPGGHFFVDSAVTDVVTAVSRALDPRTVPRAGRGVPHSPSPATLT